MKKKSQLVFDPKMARKLLKMNGDIKFCPYCGVDLVTGCKCQKNIIVDIKANRENADKSIFVFDNNDSFIEEFEKLKASKDEQGVEQLVMDID